MHYHKKRVQLFENLMKRKTRRFARIIVYFFKADIHECLVQTMGNTVNKEVKFVGQIAYINVFSGELL